MGKIKIVFDGGTCDITLSNAMDEDFEDLAEFCGNSKKENFVYRTNDTNMIIPKNKILYIVYEKDKEK